MTKQIAPEPQSRNISESGFDRRLGYFDATMVVMGGMIGAGIFLNPSFVAQSLQSSLLVIIAWSIGGVIAFIGALIFAELGAFMPQVGGQYVYLSKGIHPLVGFLNGWGLFWIIATGAIAFVSVMSADYLAVLLGLPAVWVKPMAMTIVWGLSIVNYIGVRWGSLVQNFFMLLKLAALGCLIGFAFFLPTSPQPTFQVSTSQFAFHPSFLVLMGTALVPILFSYGGWQNCNNIAEEVKNPHKILPVSIITGTVAVIVIYILVNLAYLRVLGIHGLANTTTPAAETMKRILGGTGEKLISLSIVLSTLGISNLIILASPRVFFPAVRDHGLARFAGRLHPVYRTPSFLIIAQAAWSTLLIILGTYRQLLSYVVFADWLFFALTAITLFVFRRRFPDHPRPFKVWGYPFLPALFVLFAIFIVINTFFTQTRESAIGLLLLLSGVPIFYLKRKSE